MSGTQGGNRASVLIAELLRRRDAGESVDEKSVMASHPDLAEELRDYFVNEKQFQDLIGQVPNSKPSRETRGPGVGDSVPSGTGTFDRLPVEFGRYRVSQVLGQGAMGAVYRAHDTRLGRDIALKTPKLDASTDPELIARFEREARAAAALHHRNICPVYDVGEIDGIRYLTMAYIDGKPLSDLISADRHLSEAQAATCVRKLALALEEAHQQGVIHRDLKPANIMVDRNREPIVMDFGLAHHGEAPDQSRLTAVGTLMGSPAYMSPEQVSGDPLEVGSESDIYSLGVVLFELLTGTLPFDGGVAAMIGQILSSPTPPVQTRRANCSEAMNAICLKMMAKDKAERYSSMQEVAEAMGQLLRELKSPGTKSSAKLPKVDASDAVAQISAAIENDRSTSQSQSISRNRSAKSRHTGNSRDNRKLIGIATAGVSFVILAGIIIYFRDGSRVEIPDDVPVTITENPDGTRVDIGKRPPGMANPTAATNAAVPTSTNDSTNTAQSATPTPGVNNPPQSQSGAQNASSSPWDIITEPDPKLAARVQSDGAIKIPAVLGAASIAVSPDGQQLALSENGSPGRLTIRSVVDGRILHALQYEPDSDTRSLQLTYNFDGKALVLTRGNQIQVIDPTTGVMIAKRDNPFGPSIAVFPEKPWILIQYFAEQRHRKNQTIDNYHMKIWNWDSNEVLVETPIDQILKYKCWSPSVSTDGKFITFGHQHCHVRIPVVRTSDSSIELGPPKQFEYTSKVRDRLIFSPDGRYGVSSVKSQSGMAAVLDLESMKLFRWIDPEGAASKNAKQVYGADVIFTKDSQSVITGDHSGRIAMWDVSTGEFIQEIGQFQKSGNHVWPFVEVAADNRVIAAGRIPEAPFVMIWQLDKTATPKTTRLDPVAEAPTPDDSPQSVPESTININGDPVE